VGTIGALCLVMLGCKQHPSPSPLFQLLSPDRTGITFANTITTSDTFNALTYPYIYNGAGVAIGDINNDGLPDIFLAGNMVSSRLYLNRGNMRFENITKSAGLETHGWVTGVSMIDINHDGLLDIYVCVSGPENSSGKERANFLFINHGNHTFTEEAAHYGLADTGFSQQAVFFDYDGDGNLDLFLLNNSPREFARGIPLEAGATTAVAEHYNKLYRNNGDGTFTDVSAQAGILHTIGFGLGVAIADFNGDGWPDIYVSNDITPNDVLYVNQRNGTFRDSAAAWLRHTSYAGMGVDVADFNGDGLPDIMQADMMPPDWPTRKRMSLYLTHADEVDLRRRGFRLDYEANALQLNNGPGKGFSDIARMADVAYTDWSWSVLFGDFDNDGLLDLFVTNGYPKALNDVDYKVAEFAAQRRGDRRRALQLLGDLQGYRVPNYLFHNNGDLTFTDQSSAWGMTQPGFSYGAAYADLNNDGKLDLVVNNINAPASIYENVGTTEGHYLEVELRGDSPNLRGIGTTVEAIAGGRRQYLYQSPYRGYLSTVDDRLHFGFGSATRIDTLRVTWPDRRTQVLTGVPLDQRLTLRQQEAGRTVTEDRQSATDYHAFRRIEAPPYKHIALTISDFAFQPLLPDEPSRQGPPLAVADVNGDGREDLFAGDKLYVQRPNGSFVETWHTEPEYQNWGAAFLDANGDGLPDLYVASGGYQLSPVSPLLQDRLYLNRGHGRFVRDGAALPKMLTSTAAVAVGDFNGDGKPDLFVAGRLVPRNYPYPARSYILRNDGGHFSDVTDSLCPELAGSFGMVTAAVWVDFDGDGRLDLVTAGEWMPLHFFRNEGMRFREVTASIGLGSLRGRWYSLAVGDFNHDGHPDLVAGNLGLNALYTTSAAAGHKFGVYAGDFTGSGRTDVVLTERERGRDYPIASLAPISQAVYTVSSKYSTFAAFSSASIDQLLSPAQLRGAVHYETDTFASVYLQNNGNGTFTASALPHFAQIAPIRGIVATDVDGDGNLDLVVAGNLYGMEPNTPRGDAGSGLWLRGDGRGHFAAVPPAQSGFFAPLDVTGLAFLKTPTGNAVVVANYGDSLSAVALQKRPR
jgi:hypothetical protein